MSTETHDVALKNPDPANAAVTATFEGVENLFGLKLSGGKPAKPKRKKAKRKRG